MTQAIPSSVVPCRWLLAAYVFVQAASGACVPRERPREESKSAAGSAGSAGSAGAAGSAGSAGVAAPKTAAVADDPLLEAVFTDDFERTGSAALGPAWRATSGAWVLDRGRLCGADAKNHPVWLARRLPLNASIEFQALSESADGDIKAEFWGDGRSSATGQSYTDATSYLTIFGGWKNRFHVLARLDEHAPNRREIKLERGAADFIRSTVEPNRLYQFQVERRDGQTVRWSVDGVEISSYSDEEPLRGPGHEHFGFNDWQVRVCFDNLRVTPLQD
jgi:hypothetical protein